MQSAAAGENISRTFQLNMSEHMTIKQNLAAMEKQMKALDKPEEFPPPNVHGSKK